MTPLHLRRNPNSGVTNTICVLQRNVNYAKQFFQVLDVVGANSVRSGGVDLVIGYLENCLQARAAECR